MQAYRWRDPKTVMRYGARLAVKSGASARMAVRLKSEEPAIKAFRTASKWDTPGSCLLTKSPSSFYGSQPTTRIRVAAPDEGARRLAAILVHRESSEARRVGKECVSTCRSRRTQDH